MDELVLLQSGPEDFRVLFDGRQVAVTLSQATRRGLGVQGVAPVTVATEVVRFLLERDDLPLDADEPVALGPAAGQHTGFVDELRSRLS